jgi:drug/metabolite transporter (DMT)-like permease
MNSPRLQAVLQALFVTFLWSTSWVLIKFGLSEIPPLTFAGLRYSLAFLALLPVLRRSGASLSGLSRRDWGRLLLLGLTFYALTQGGQFVTLSYLPATTFSLLLNFTSVLVLLFGFLLLKERPSRLQMLGLALFMLGVLAYFHPFSGFEWKAIGLLFAGITVASNALASVLGRHINRERRFTPALVTTISMGAGALILLAAGLALEGVPRIDPGGWLIIVWLAAVNTAFAFTLWNRTLQELPAMESSIINNSMLIQIALLAWIFLGERLTGLEILGLLLAALGILVVNLKT